MTGGWRAAAIVGIVAISGAVAWASVGRSAADAHGRAEGRTQVTVFAAASLTQVMERIAADFEAAHPAVDVRLVYGGSSDLAAQILEGAPAHVFVAADEAQMAAVADHVRGEPVIIATNSLTLVVPEGNPAAVTGLADLGRDDVTSVVCAPQVPCGAATVELATLLRVALSPSSQEQSVTDVLGKVSSGQADAGVVYVTDVDRAGGVEAIAIDGAGAVVNRYAAAALAGATPTTVPQDFVEYLAGRQARAALAAAGFGAP